MTGRWDRCTVPLVIIRQVYLWEKGQTDRTLIGGYDVSPLCLYPSFPPILYLPQPKEKEEEEEEEEDH